jgi:hypothetical protein
MYRPVLIYLYLLSDTPALFASKTKLDSICLETHADLPFFYLSILGTYISKVLCGINRIHRKNPRINPVRCPLISGFFNARIRKI